MKTIDRKAWREAFAIAVLDDCGALHFGGSLVSGADAMADRLGIAFADLEPPEVELAKMVDSWEQPSALGRLWSFSPAEYDRARELSRKILIEHHYESRT